jgi:hemerythrin-like metal-binding protein
MSLLQWNADFETGIPAADHEHGKLVDLINTIYDIWERRGDLDSSTLFDELGNTQLSHFEFEDRIMTGYKYAGHAAHTRDHDQVLVQLRGIVAHTSDANYDLAGALASCLQPWLADHVKRHDAPLFRALLSGDGAATSDGKNRSGRDSLAGEPF